MDMSHRYPGDNSSSEDSPMMEWSTAAVVGWIGRLEPAALAELAEVFEMVGTDGAQLARLTIEDIVEAEEELGISEEDGRSLIAAVRQHLGAEEAAGAGSIEPETAAVAAAPPPTHGGGSGKDSGAGEVGACTPQYDLGVTVGKFFPLHRGHALLISRASAVVRRLVVLCSGRDGDSVPMATRAAWIRSLFPDRARIEVLEVVDGLSEAPVRLATPGLFVLGTDVLGNSPTIFLVCAPPDLQPHP
jgi:hypothetical protein